MFHSENPAIQEMGNTQGGFKAKIIGLPSGGSADKDKYSAQQRQQSFKFQKAYQGGSSANYSDVGNSNSNTNTNINTAGNVNNKNFVGGTNVSDYNSSGYSASGSLAGSPVSFQTELLPNFRNEVPAVAASPQKEAAPIPPVPAPAPLKKKKAAKPKPKPKPKKQPISKGPKRYDPSEEEEKEQKENLRGFLRMFTYSVERQKQTKVSRTWNTSVAIPPPAVEPRKVKPQLEVMPLPLPSKASFSSPEPSRRNVLHLGRGLSQSPPGRPKDPLQSPSLTAGTLERQNKLRQFENTGNNNILDDVEDNLNLTPRENAIAAENATLIKRLAALEQT